MSAFALPAPPADLLSELVALSASVRAAWLRPPKWSVVEIAQDIQGTLGVLEAARHSLVRLEAGVRSNLAGIVDLTNAADAFPRDLAVQFIAEVETMLATVPAEVPEGNPFERLLKNVIEPYNDALRQYRRSLQDYHAALSRLLVAIDACNAADVRLARAVVDDQADDVVSWVGVRDNVRKIR